MKLKFTTSTGALIEGRVIDVEPPLGPDVAEWIRLGVLVPVHETDEVTLPPEAVEKAIARRTSGQQPKRTRQPRRKRGELA
jgi:hypothetical protein